MPNRRLLTIRNFSHGDFTFKKNVRKTQTIEDVKDGRIVKDDIEAGHGTIIPLWHFGMNYY